MMGDGDDFSSWILGRPLKVEELDLAVRPFLPFCLFLNNLLVSIYIQSCSRLVSAHGI